MTGIKIRPGTGKALRQLQGGLRNSRTSEAIPPGMSGRVPHDMATDDFRWVYLSRAEKLLLDSAKDAVLADPALEHLGRDVDDQLWRLVCQCVQSPGDDNADRFRVEHAREPQTQTVCFSVRFLLVEEPFEVAGVRFLPLDSEQVVAREGFLSEPDVAAIAAAIAVGTDVNRVVDRARASVEHALKLLRLGARERLDHRQLRFRIGEQMAFIDGRTTGWSRRADAAFEALISADQIERILAQPLASLPAGDGTDVQLRAVRAIQWLDNARFAEHELDRLLFRFFALEALLGDRAAGHKARPLAYRHAMLAYAITGAFGDPNVTFLVYSGVRSAAVHGDEPRDVDPRWMQGLDADLHGAVNNFLDFAHGIGATKQVRVRQALDQHPEREEMLSWLRASDPETWSDFWV